MKITSEDFLSVFFDSDDDVNIRVFPDRKAEDTAFKGKNYTIKLCDIGSLIPTLQEHNAKNRGIFFVVNSGGQSDSEINHINAQFVESDTLSLEEQLERIQKFTLEPSIIVKTQKSLHTYWLMSNAKVEDFRRIQKKLAVQFDGDNTCVNESRVLRIPSFNHCKGKPIEVECIKFNPKLKYTHEELEAALPELPSETPKKETEKGCNFGLNTVCERCLFINHCCDNAATLSEHDWYSLITNLAVFNGGADLIHKYSKDYPNYNKEETNKKIEHFIKSKTKPINCETIVDKGFKCPNFGICHCKSPAGLTFLPLTVVEVSERFNKLEPTADPLKDMALIKENIRKYLYNADKITVDTVLDMTLKKKFKLTNTRELKSYWQEIQQEYRSMLPKVQSDFPAWLIPTKNGVRFNAGILGEHLGTELKCFYAAEQFHVYKHGVYSEISDDEALGIVKGYIPCEYSTMAGIRDAKEQWKISVLKRLKDVNCNPFILNLKNGLYDTVTNTLKEHNDRYLSTVQLNVGFSDDAQCPLFIRFIEQMLPADILPLVQEMMGYLLIPVTKAQKSFVIVGPPRTGKSTLLWIIESLLLGDENVSNIAWQELGDRFKTAELFGKLANIFADLPNKAIEDAGVFKVLTGEDYLMAEKKGKNPFKFKPFARLVFSCNEIPKNYGDRTEAFYRRLIIIPFEKQISAEDVDTKLKEKLMGEADGIFMWALEGLKRLMDNNFQFSETERTRSEIEKYKTESNSVLLFVQENCELNPKSSCNRAEFYNAYKEYCNESGMKPLSQVKFNKEVELNFKTVSRTKDSVTRRKCFVGIKLCDLDL